MITWEQLEEMVREHMPDREMAKSVSIHPDTLLFRDLKYDSVALIELLAEIEERCGVDYTSLPDFADKMDRCGDFYQGIQELCNGK
ncbi:MAG: acyl carrier protein [Eubacteriales bacterium]|nr:acyl carrier protein [Eubacteriales bacterium]